MFFILPGAYFAYKGYMTKRLSRRSLVLGSLIGAQGVLGWMMVKSGLDLELIENNSHPRVSHYFLAAHLGSAFMIYSGLFLTGLQILSKVPEAINDRQLAKFKRLAIGTASMVFITALSGALVAGLDAGLIYNEFPYMGLGLVPADMWQLSTYSERNTEPIPWWRNLLENPSAVQFNHRLMATSTSTAILGLWAYSRKLPLPAPSRLAINALLGVTTAQVGLGISTLIYFVPTELAAAHQAGSLTLLSVALWLIHTLRMIR
jgi:cytochrome c oxidase assembly protein subunit 15